MPKPIQSDDPDRESERMKLVEASRSAFIASSDWKRSKRTGNLWREWSRMTLTVFRREGESSYRWSIANGESPRYSKFTYNTEDEAMGSLWSEVEGQYL